MTAGSRARIRLALLTLPLALSTWACDQFRVRGAVDPCPEEEGLTDGEIGVCQDDGAALLRSDRTDLDRTGGGLLHGEPLPFGGRPLRHVVALDYSGSMFGGYNNPEPSPPPCGWGTTPQGARTRNAPYYWETEDFAELLAGGPLARLSDDEQVYTMPFNRLITVRGEGGVSTYDPVAKTFRQALPGPLVGGQAALRALTSVGSGNLPADPNGAGFGDPSETHLDEVLGAAAAVFESSEERDGVLWIVTDNIIEKAGQGSQGNIRNVQFNRRFYESMQSDPRWQVVYAWPIHRAGWLCGSTLMVYGMYYSSRELLDELAYRELTTAEPAKLAHASQIGHFRRYADQASPSPGRPFKLKPDFMDVVRLSFVGRVDCLEMEVGERGACETELSIENLLNHRQVERGRFVLESWRCEPWGLEKRTLREVRTAVPMCSRAIHGSVELDEPIAPGQKTSVRTVLLAPPVKMELRTLADHWESANFERFLMVGGMGVGIENLQTSMVIAEEALGDVYGVGALPEVFRNPSTESLATSVCLILSVDNPSHLASLLILALVGAVALGVVAVGWLVRPMYRIVEIGGEEQGRIRLTRYSWSRLDWEGRTIARARLALGGNPVLRGVGENVIRKRGSGWEHSTADGLGGERSIRLVLRSRKTTTRSIDDGF